MSSTVEAKAICIKHLEDILVDPMFTIFHVQHKQIESRTDSDSDLIHHFKNSMSKVKTWNSNVVKDFCSSLPIRFPQLNDLERLFFELQDITCNILNESSISNKYSPVRDEIHHILHAFVSACSDSFIGNIEWFAVDENSPEFQTYKSNAKKTMQQTNMVENVAMTFIKAESKDGKSNPDLGGSESESDNSASDSESDSDKEVEIEGEGEAEGEAEGEEDEKLQSKHIDLTTGASYGGDNDEIDIVGKFSTFIDEDKKSNVSKDSKNSERDSSKGDSESDTGSEGDESKDKSKDESSDDNESDTDSEGDESSDESSEDIESDESSDDSESDESSDDSESDESSDDSESDESSDDSESDESSDDSESDESSDENESSDDSSSGYDTDTDDDSLDSVSDLDISIISYSDDDSSDGSK